VPFRVLLSFRRVVLLAGPLRFRLRRWRFDALRRQIEIAVESADRPTIKGPLRSSRSRPGRDLL